MLLSIIGSNRQRTLCKSRQRVQTSLTTKSRSGFESALCVSGGRSSRLPAPYSIQHIQPPQPTTAEGVAAITAANPFPFPTSDGFVRFEEAPCVLDDLVDVLLRILPGMDGHLGVRGEAGDFHGHLRRSARMRGLN